jgi:hypothetical protein
MPPPGPDGKPNFQSEDFEGFVEDIFEEVRKCGEVENIAICENLTDHMIGNVYIRFAQHEEAEAAVKMLSGRFYNGTVHDPTHAIRRNLVLAFVNMFSSYEFFSCPHLELIYSLAKFTILILSPVASHCRFFLYFLSNQVNWCCPSTRPSLISARRVAANSTSRRALAVATAISCISNAFRASCCGVCARQSATSAAAAARDPDAARAVATAAAATIIAMAAAGRIVAEAAAAAMGANTSVVDRRRRAAIASAAIATVMNPLPPLHRRPPPPRRDPSGRTAKSGAKRLPSGMPSARSVRRRARAQSNRQCERREK